MKDFKTLLSQPSHNSYTWLRLWSLRVDYLKRVHAALAEAELPKQISMFAQNRFSLRP